MIDDINEIRALATKYSVQQLRNLADLKLLDPIKAVMAGNMINHIQKQNAKPPSTSVAQDLLGIQQQMPMQGQQQPQMPPQEMPQQAPPQMAQAPAGIEGLPAGDVGNYAGGGIVAFDDGGRVPGYAGADGSVTTSSPVGRGLSRFFGGRTYSPDVTQQLKALDEQYQALAARDRQLNGMFGFQQQTPAQQAEAAKVKQQMQEVFQQSQSLKNTRADPAAAPAVDQSAAETARLQRQDTILNPIGGDNIPPAPLPPPRRDAPPPTLTSGKPITPPTLGEFAPIKIAGADRPPAATVSDLRTIKKTREEQEEAEGFNKNLTAEQIKRIEDKQKKLEDFESRAGGEALFNFGLGLLGAKEGEEAQRAGESGKASLEKYTAARKDLRLEKEKLDERAEALRLAENQARKTNSAADIAELKRQQDKFDAQKMEFYKSENDLLKTGAQVGAQVRNTDVQAATSMYTAQLSAQTQRDVARLSAETQRWVASRPPAEILAIEEVARRTGKPFEQAMKDFYGARAGARNMYTREEAMRDARKNLEAQAIVNPTEAQMQAEINKLMRIHGGDSGGGGTLQQGANGSFNYVPRQ
jgi:hypothetical protein